MPARMLWTSPLLSQEHRAAPDADAAPGTARAGEQSEAERAELWNQMLSTIIVDPVDGAAGGAPAQRRPSVRGPGAAATSALDGLSRPGGLQAALEQAEADFRDRPTFGLPQPVTPRTGRTVVMMGSQNGSTATLYRQLNAVLARNQVRRELRLGERYEKPNEKRRRKRSERHRRRFRDMVRKKIQLVRYFSDTRSCRCARAASSW